ncbi:MAG: hypothetical protein WC572_00405 [Candidatus Omnitrophota bacterium]
MNKIIFFLLICVCLSAYCGYLNNGFVFDDKILVEENPLVKSCAFFPDIFRTGAYDYWTGGQPYDRMYRPVQTVSYLIDYGIWGGSPAGFRLTNILLHLFNSLLIFYMLSLIFENRLLAACAGILFMAHPVHISVVAYIAGRADLLSTFFILLSCVLFLRYSVSAKKVFYVFSFLAALAATFSRENALFLPVFLMLANYFMPARKAGFKSLWAFMLLPVVYAGVRFAVFGFSGLSMHPASGGPYFSLLNFLNIIARYIMLLVYPVDLRMFHSLGFINNVNLPVLILVFSVLGLVLFAAFAKKKFLPRQIIFAWLWFFAGLFPVYFYFGAYAGLGRALMAENWLYLSSAGFCLFAAYLCLLNRRGVLIVWVCVLLFSCAIFLNRKYWKNEVSFYERTLSFLPPGSILLKNLVFAYIESGDFTKAGEAIKELEKEYADTPAAYICRGQYYLSSGEPEKALAYYGLVAKRSFFTNYSVSLCYAKTNEFDKAVGFAKESFRQNPFFRKNAILLAELCERTGRGEEAAGYLSWAKSLDAKGR